MSESSVKIALTTRPGRGLFSVQHYAKPDVKISAQLNINLVLAMSIPNTRVVINPDHSAIASTLDLMKETCHESITLPLTKADRLLSFFERLKPDHQQQCHDLVVATEGWDKDYGPEITQKAVQPKTNVQDFEGNIIPGNPYTVQILRGTPSKPNFGLTHSCIGTDDGRLLGLMGRGLVLATIAPEDTRQFYANGAVLAFLARTIIPASLG